MSTPTTTGREPQPSCPDGSVVTNGSEVIEVVGPGTPVLVGTVRVGVRDPAPSRRQDLPKAATVTVSVAASGAGALIGI